MITRLLIASAVAGLFLPGQTVVEQVAATPVGRPDTSTVLQVKGHVAIGLSLSLEDLAGMPHYEAEATIHGRTVAYRGISLGELLELAEVPEGGDLLRTIVFARAPDGYEVVFALAELSGDFNDRTVLIADRRDGEPLPPEEGPLRLVVPWEKRGARSVRQVSEIEVRVLP